MTRRGFSLLCVVLIGLGLSASIVVGVQRWRIEAANGGVEIIVDYEEAKLFAMQKGLSVDECLHRLKEAGATSIAIQEITLERLVADGRLDVEPSSRRGEVTFVLKNVGQSVDYLMPYLRDKVPGVRRLGFAGLSIPYPGDAILRTGLGLPVETVRQVKDAGLLPVARPANDVLVSEEYIRRLFSDLSMRGVKNVVFAGNSVMGFPGLLEEAAKHLSDQGLNYCWVEFARQQGGRELGRLLDHRLLRLHSVSAEEMLRLKPQQALDRFVRAAKERSIRLLYVHLPLSPSSDAEADPLRFVKTLAYSLEQSGFRLEQAEPVPDYSPRFVWVLLVVLGICASPFLLLNAWGLGGPRLLAVLLGALTVGAVGMMLTGQGLGRPLLALLAAVAFPILAVVFLLPRCASSTPPSLSRALANALLRVVACVLISAVGGLLVAAILSDTSYFVGGQLFRGIKLAQALPLVVIFALFIGGEAGNGGQLRPSEAKIREFLGVNLQVRHLLGLLLLLLLAAVWMMRTGNQPDVGTIPLEMKMREFLEDTLGARPRLKEFLLGHPLLLLGFVIHALAPRSGWRPWGMALILVGTLGQVSVINTFCHLHSPLYLALWRTFNGLWLGCLLGAFLAVLILGRVLRPSGDDA